MQIAIISAALGLFFFVVLYLGFRTGLRLGMQTAKGQVPPKINPVKTVKEAVSPPKPDPATEQMIAGWQRMQEYDGFTPEERQVT